MSPLWCVTDERATLFLIQAEGSSAGRSRERRNVGRNSDGSGQAEVHGAQAGRRKEGGRGPSQGRPSNCSQEDSCDPTAETEKEPGDQHP